MKKQQPHSSNRTQREVAERFHVAPVTVFNWVKEGLLDLDENRCVTKESLRRFQKHYVGKVKLHARANKQLKDGQDHDEVDRIIQKALGEEPFDNALGDRYEAMLSESHKNKEGIFYTPLSIVEDMMREAVMNADTVFLDPCCGTGNFLVKAVEKGVRPQNLYGFDTDPNAVMIARKRVRELTGCEADHVVCADFLQTAPALPVRFDKVFTNPPWGKKLPKEQRMDYAKRYQAGSSTDTCSLFLFAILSVLKPDGQIGLLLPDSFFKIAVFEDARKAVLRQTLLRVKDHGKPFDNLYSAVSVLLRQGNGELDNMVLCNCNKREFRRSQQSFLRMPRHNINYWTGAQEQSLLEELLQRSSLTLKDHATWGMGIVTGNNAKMCKRSWRKGLVPVYRGKDILPGRLKAAQYYINPLDFPHYQQMAPLERYGAPEKLIYRFISSRLVFYCDTRQRYVLNSANMLVLDDDFPLSAKELAAVLNSPLSNWLFQQLFHTHKILRSDLELLPIITDSALHRRFNLLDLNR